MSETKIYPSDPKNYWQEDIRKHNQSNKTFLKGDLLTEHQYSNHSDKVREKFSFMIKNNGEIPEKFKTKKFAQRLLPKKWGNKGPTITATSLPDDFVHYSQARSPTVREWQDCKHFQTGINLLVKELLVELEGQATQENRYLKEKS